MSPNANGSRLRAIGRGAVAAMAMTGMRTFTANLGLLESTPPEAIAEQAGPSSLQPKDPAARAALIELAHWSYGAAGGAAYTALPERVRASAWAGPAYGIAVWLLFELGLGPLLGVNYTRQQRLSGKIVVALDHAVYGAIVAHWYGR